MAPQFRRQAAIAPHIPEVIEDVGVQQVDGLALAHPAVDLAFPAPQAVAAVLVLRHHPADTIDEAGRIHDVGGAPAELGIPGIVAFGTGMNQGIVLIGGKQAFAAPGRTQHQESPGGGRLSLSLLVHGLFRQASRPRGNIAQRVADDLGDLRRAQAFRQQPAGHDRQPAIGPRQGIGIAGRGDILAQRQGGTGPLAQQRAGHDDADRPAAAALHHAEVTDAPAVHARDRNMQEVLRCHRDHRVRQQTAHGARQGRSTIGCDRPQHVMLGHDAGRPAGLVDRNKRAHLAQLHRARRGLQRVGWQYRRHRAAHLLGNTVPVDEGIDAFNDGAIHGSTSRASAADAGSRAAARRI